MATPIANLSISPKVLEKLGKKTPPVTRREVEQCFENRLGALLRDTREKHKTIPPTLWFIAKTNNNRLLKIVFIQRDGRIELKSAYDPDSEELRIYLKYGC